MGPLTFFGADCVEIASGEASREGPMEPLVSALLILHRLLVERDGLPQWLVCNTEKQSRCRRHRSAGRTGVRLRSLGFDSRTPVTPSNASTGERGKQRSNSSQHQLLLLQMSFIYCELT